MDKRYEPKKFEEKIYKKWEKSGGFEAKIDRKKKPFTILMPPPNANASLHAGQGMYTVDDVLIRWKRMQGYAASWIPGIDHAGFETQYVYEKKLMKEGKSRLDFERETLYKNIFEFVKENSGLIYQQFKRLGFSADWEKSVFTLNKEVIERVFQTFERMAEEKLIYRGDYMVNYCPHCGTSLAELEVKHEEKKTPLYYLKYGPFVLATTRPETKFGDTAVAIHPEDKRYKKYVGKEIEVQGLIGKFKIKVIADKAVDPEFGTGVVKITPAHDFNDFEIGKRHDLEIKQVIGLDGRLNELAGPYKGLTINKAREKVVTDLKKKGLMEKIDQEYENKVAVCYKCKRDLEPTIIPNWFVKVEKLKKPVIEAVKKDQVRFYPKRGKKQMLRWLERMRDWPISRQIAWGIRIPVWYSVKENPNLRVVFLNKKGESVSGLISELLKKYKYEEVEAGLQKLMAPNQAKYVIARKKPGEGFLQETDTFDTWFSSGHWPIVAFKKFSPDQLPTDVLGTLIDILEFWVSRMMMFSLYLYQKIPFKKVYLWSMVTDEKGQKMSKSKGNVINPVELVEKYGADALRMALLFSSSQGGRVALSEDKVRGMRNLTNKIWNASRFIVMKRQSTVNNQQSTEQEDKKFYEKLNQVVKEATKQLENFRIGMATETVYNEFWHWFCDECIEDNKQGKIGQKALFHGLIVFLKLFHPFIPFVTEAVWEEIGDLRKYPKQMLMNSEWPTYAEASAAQNSKRKATTKNLKLIKILVWFALGLTLGAGIKLAGNLQIRQEIEAQVEERQKIVEEIQALEILDQEKPDWRDLKLKTALLYWQLGEQDEAIKWLEEAKLLDPNGEKVAEVEIAIMNRD